MSQISVIIPVYNGEKTIQETIQSVLRQTYSNLEIILINANSSDATLDIVTQIQDKRLKILTYPKANAAVNRNRGLLAATGEFITFLDADDIWTADKLEEQYKALAENQQASVVYSWTDAIDESGQFLRPCSHATWQGDVYAKLLLDDFIGSGSNVMARSFVFTKVGGFNETFTNAEDTDMWIRLAAHYHFVPVKKVQVLYRVSVNSKSSNILGLETSNLKIIEQTFADTPSLSYLKPYRIANLYKYLSYKVLSVPPGLHNSRQAARILWKTIVTDANLLFKLVIYKALLKLVIMTVLSPKQATVLLERFPRLSNISTIFGYIKTSLP